MITWIFSVLPLTLGRETCYHGKKLGSSGGTVHSMRAKLIDRSIDHLQNCIMFLNKYQLQHLLYHLPLRIYALKYMQWYLKNFQWYTTLETQFSDIEIVN
jgi:hypothetical protein